MSDENNFGTIGHSAVGIDPLVAVTALMMGMRLAKRQAQTNAAKPRTREQIAVENERTERQRWNDAVDARKAAKRAGGSE